MVLPTLDPRFNKVLTRAVPIGVAEDILLLKLMNEDSLNRPPDKFLTLTIFPNFNLSLGTLSEQFI